MVWTLVSFLAGCGASGPGLDRPGRLGAAVPQAAVLSVPDACVFRMWCRRGHFSVGPSDDGAPARVWCRAG